MHYQTPAQISHHLGFSPRDNKLISQDSRGLLNLKLVKPTISNNNQPNNQLTDNNNQQPIINQ